MVYDGQDIHIVSYVKYLGGIMDEFFCYYGGFLLCFPQNEEGPLSRAIPQ